MHGPVVVCHGAAVGADLASGIALAARLVTDGSIDQVAAVDAAYRARRDTTDNQTPAAGGVAT